MKAKIEFKPKMPVTIKKMKVLAKYGINTVADKSYTEALLSIGANTEALKEICENIFEGDFSNINLDDFDLGAFHAGLRDFLSGYLAPSKK